ncbi:MAG TPA: SagB/ThcOx family dehydrogenase [Armatimonadota bacterium]|nr:SagB/ThcOx family dehydrogenase [Armatimonadota bacterium]
MRKRSVLAISAAVGAVAAACIFSTISCRTENSSAAREEATIKFPAPSLDGKTSLEAALQKRRSVRSYTSEPLTLAQVSQLLWAAQGISDPARGFRTAPSAGALYPLKVYLVAGNVKGLSPGVYRYEPKGHKLALVAKGDQRGSLCAASLSQSPIKEAPASIAILGDYSITARKYGERAPRYVHIEVGHAGQNVLLQAVALNLGAVGMGAFEDEQVRKALGAPDNETPLYIIPVGNRKPR